MTLRPVKKPAKRKQAERAWNSSLPRPQKKLVAKKRLRPVNRKRRAENFERAYGGLARVEWVRGLPCLTCRVVGFTENAHIQNGGRGRKADARFIIPLCIYCHEELHRVGQWSFEEIHEISLRDAAARVEELWQLRGGNKSGVLPAASPKLKNANDLGTA